MQSRTTDFGHGSPDKFAPALLRRRPGDYRNALCGAAVHGGAQPVGRLLFVGCACWIAVAWSLHQCFARRAWWTSSRYEWLLLLGFGVVVLQLIPMPGTLLQRLSPAVYQLLPLWSGESVTAQLGHWRQISLAPAETRGGLVMYLAYAMLFVTVVQRIRSIEDVERLLRWIACASTAMALLGLLQFLVGNGRFLWVYEHPSRNTFDAVKGAFANQNHFAHFLALGLGPLLWWCWCRPPSREARSRRFAENRNPAPPARDIDPHVLPSNRLTAASCEVPLPRPAPPCDRSCHSPSGLLYLPAY